jgi:hypothetical protein
MSPSLSLPSTLPPHREQEEEVEIWKKWARGFEERDEGFEGETFAVDRAGDFRMWMDFVYVCAFVLTYGLSVLVETPHRRITAASL